MADWMVYFVVDVCACSTHFERWKQRSGLLWVLVECSIDRSMQWLIEYIIAWLIEWLMDVLIESISMNANPHECDCAFEPERDRELEREHERDTWLRASAWTWNPTSKIWVGMECESQEQQFFNKTKTIINYGKFKQDSDFIKHGVGWEFYTKHWIRKI